MSAIIKFGYIEAGQSYVIQKEDWEPLAYDSQDLIILINTYGSPGLVAKQLGVMKKMARSKTTITFDLWDNISRPGDVWGRQPYTGAISYLLLRKCDTPNGIIRKSGMFSDYNIKQTEDLYDPEDKAYTDGDYSILATFYPGNALIASGYPTYAPKPYGYRINGALVLGKGAKSQLHYAIVENKRLNNQVDPSGLSAVQVSSTDAKASFTSSSDSKFIIATPLSNVRYLKIDTSNIDGNTVFNFGHYGTGYYEQMENRDYTLCLLTYNGEKKKEEPKQEYVPTITKYKELVANLSVDGNIVASAMQTYQYSAPNTDRQVIDLVIDQNSNTRIGEENGIVAINEINLHDYFVQKVGFEPRGGIYLNVKIEGNVALVGNSTNSAGLIIDDRFNLIESITINNYGYVLGRGGDGGGLIEIGQYYGPYDYVYPIFDNKNLSEVTKGRNGGSAINVSCNKPIVINNYRMLAGGGGGGGSMHVVKGYIKSTNRKAKNCPPNWYTGGGGGSPYGSGGKSGVAKTGGSDKDSAYDRQEMGKDATLFLGGSGVNGNTTYISSMGGKPLGENNITEPKTAPEYRMVYANVRENMQPGGYAGKIINPLVGDTKVQVIDRDGGVQRGN